MERSSKFEFSVNLQTSRSSGSGVGDDESEANRTAFHRSSALGDLGKPQHNNVGYRSLRVEFSVDGSAYPGCLLDWADGDFRAGAQTK